MESSVYKGVFRSFQSETMTKYMFTLLVEEQHKGL